ncbi:RyR domain-containing protein [Microbacterium sp. DT81.1]|uniref:RyR domain-containing protein n=1 Tax=Microbacterium sp. DT81.1 TaxID=3393413 RepID=UPI003CEA18BB
MLRRIAIAIAAAACIAVGALLVVAALTPFGSPVGVWSPFWDPQSWQVVTLAVALALALGVLVFPRGHRQHSARPLAGILLIGTAAVGLGLAAYSTCARESVAFWSPLTWAFGLFVGSAPEVFGSVSGCPADPPLALTVARLLAIATVGLGFALAAAVVFRTQLDVLRMRRARSRVVVDGPLDVTLAAASAIRRRTAPGTLIIVRAEAIDPPPPLQRQAGIVVLRWGDSADGALRSFSLRRGRIALDALYLLSPDTGTNMLRFERLSQHLDAIRGDRHVRVVVRIDDAWVAEYWRRRQVDRPLWAVDAVGLNEATAQRLVTRWMDDGHDLVAVHGESGLVLAIAAEVAQRSRELKALRSAEGPRPPRIAIVGRDAEALVRQHALHQRAFGNAADDVDAFPCDDPTSGFTEALASARSPAVMTAPGSKRPRLSPTELAASRPGWPVYAQVADDGAIPEEPVMEGLYPFALSFSDFGGAPDRWERVARIAHTNFLADYGEDAAVPARRRWDAGLPAFYKESNVRLIRATLASAVAVGRSWGPATGDGDPGDVLPTEEQLEIMTQREHESWRAHYLAAGWRFGQRRDDARRRHPGLIEWSDLDEANREKSRRSVRDALALLRTLGYVSRPVRDAAGTWGRYRRLGEVTAELLTNGWTWETARGSTMEAHRGDWRVHDGERMWSVRAPEFEATYEPAGEGRWRRRGVVRAMQARTTTIVQTLEGTARAEPGDWVVEGQGGERWVVPSEHFQRTYAPEQ